MSPPPPKQPQSIEYPRIHTLEMPTMNPIMSSAVASAAQRVKSPSSSSRASATSAPGSAQPRKSTHEAGNTR